ncbi:outer membrane beta-barrel protein [Helicobacter trogontum]|uniref:outer membrane beta-barrel protein n=1 Tax=Helicobacter trogontum TaxID=50960 RepID=UPI002A917B8E|nr:outer membrane beta-barrel protein [Helicobacter trogontum]MDY5186169.1 outer membrane beta-barrel protein [Helicobacter trogontum]
MKAYIALALSLSLCGYAQVYKRTTPQPPKEKSPINAQSKTGFMLGFENAYILHTHHDASQMNIALGLNLGYNVYFNDKVGMRIFGNYTRFLSDLATGNAGTDYAGTNRFGFGLDFLYDYFNNNDLGLSLGIFAGLGFGYDLQSYMFVDSQKNFDRSGFYSYATLGLNIIFDSSNRVDIGYRYTFLNANWINHANNEKGSIASPFALVIGYSYIF